MNNPTRRVFFRKVAAGTSVLAATQAMAQAPAMVDAKDPTAAALGYAADTTKVDAKKYAKHTNDQMCSNCQLYPGKPKKPPGPSPWFAGKQVAAKGRSPSYAQKAG